MRIRLVGFLLPLVVAVTAASPARAQEDPRKVEAQGVFDEAMRLHEAHRDAEALPLFRRAYAIFPSPNALFNVARAEQLTGARAQALRHYREAAKNPLLNPTFRDVAVERIRELEAQVGHLRFVLPEGATVSVDGDAVDAPGEPFPVEPGSHDVALGTGARRHVDVAAGRTTSVDFLAPEASFTPPPDEPRSSSSGATRWIVAGTAGVLSVTAATLAVVFEFNRAGAKERAETLFPGSPPTGCAGNPSTACVQYDEARQDQAANTNRARAFAVTAGVFGAAAVGALLLWPKPSSSRGSSVRVVPGVGDRAAALTVVGQF